MRLKSFVIQIFDHVLASLQIRAANAYQSPQGDLISRQNLFNKYIPDQEFVDYCASLHDEEMAYTFEELLLGETLEEARSRETSHKKLILELSESIVYEILDHVSRTLIYA